MMNKIKNMNVEKKLKYCFTRIVVLASISGILSNSAFAQETSATSEELSAQTESLEQLVKQFTLKEA